MESTGLTTGLTARDSGYRPAGVAAIPDQGRGQVCDRGLPQRLEKRLPRRFAPRNDDFDVLYNNKCCAREVDMSSFK